MNLTYSQKYVLDWLLEHYGCGRWLHYPRGSGCGSVDRELEEMGLIEVADSHREDRKMRLKEGPALTAYRWGRL